MPKKTLTRRQFLVGCSTAIAALAGSRLTRLAFAHPDAAGAANQQILVFVFLRGGWDALNVVPPISSNDRGFYEAARTDLQIPASGTDSALPLDSRFGLHPAMAPLYEQYQGKKLAIVHAVGLTSDTRSHFDAMQYIELGSPGNKTTNTGWLTRHLMTAPSLPATILMPALSAGSSQAMSLLGSQEAVVMNETDSFSFVGNWQFADRQRSSLRRIYNGDTWIYQAGIQTLDAVDLIDSMDPGGRNCNEIPTYIYLFIIKYNILCGMKVSIGQAAKALGVSMPTLRRWEKEGKIQAQRTPHGHRRYDLAQLRGLKPYETSKTNRPGAVGHK